MQLRMKRDRAVSKIMVIAALAGVCPAGARAQIPALPDGAETTWVVDGAEEIVTHVIFNPEWVAERLPRGLAFLTMADLAEAGNAQAQEQLELFPNRAGWGVSFLEIVRQEIFEIDGRAPDLPPDGAIALWFAAIKPAADNPGAERGRLILDLWVPDSAYVAYMTSKGHYATYGDVGLSRTADGVWEGSIELPDLQVQARCRPNPDVRPLSSNRQLLYPPAGSGLHHVIRTGYVGHKERTCEEEAWKFAGDHPLTDVVRIGGSVVQFGYRLHGGAYRFRQR